MSSDYIPDSTEEETVVSISKLQEEETSQIDTTETHEHKFTLYNNFEMEPTKVTKPTKKESKPIESKPKKEEQPISTPKEQPEPDPHPFKFKQVILVRTDLKLSPGKLAAQVAHAAVDAFNLTSPLTRKSWLDEGHCKIVLQVADETALLHYYTQAQSLGLPTALIRDFGLTEIVPNTTTAVAIGPAPAEAITELTKQLRLFWRERRCFPFQPYRLLRHFYIILPPNTN